MVLKFFDFWFSDFSWYRLLTKRVNDEWYFMTNEVNTCFWVRDDKNFNIKLDIVKLIDKHYPNLDRDNEAEVLEAAKDIVEKYYGKEK